ncbi:hypothetical protein DIPPA_20790 [Diplonema papillatum]|nr:hypothetical protein DIPPA_20790 [Diplonema papillatum]
MTDVAARLPAADPRRCSCASVEDNAPGGVGDDGDNEVPEEIDGVTEQQQQQQQHRGGEVSEPSEVPEEIGDEDRDCDDVASDQPCFAAAPSEQENRSPAFNPRVDAGLVAFFDKRRSTMLSSRLSVMSTDYKSILHDQAAELDIREKSFQEYKRKSLLLGPADAQEGMGESKVSALSELSELVSMAGEGTELAMLLEVG